MTRRTLFLAVLIVAVAGSALVGWLVTNARNDVVEVSLEEPGTTAGSVGAAGGEPLRIAVAAMTSPKSTFIYYQDVLEYIGAKTGRPVDLIQRESYEEVNDLLEEGQLDMAFVCTGAYVEGHEEFGMEIIAGPVVYGAPEYYSYTIVSTDSTAVTFEDLRGSTFAFTDPMSNTGTLVPTYLLGQMGETPDSFFSEYIYTYSHDRSIEAVAGGITDGAAVDSLIYDYLKATGDPVVTHTRVLATSPPYGIPPVVVHPDLDPALKAELRDVLLGMHADPKGREILSNIRIDRFEVVPDSSYDSVREMQAWSDANATP